MADPALPAGRIVEDTVVPAGAPWWRRLAAGQHLRFVDLDGQQAIDFLCYAADDPLDRYNASNTIRLNGNIYLSTGTVLWSVKARRMMTITDDSCGQHDTIGGCCSAELNELRYDVKDTPSCQANFRHMLGEIGRDERDIVTNVNLFMYVPVRADGHIELADGRSKPGDHVDLRAEMDLYALASNCPQRYNPACGFNPTPVRAIVYVPE